MRTATGEEAGHSLQLRVLCTASQANPDPPGIVDSNRLRGDQLRLEPLAHATPLCCKQCHCFHVDRLLRLEDQEERGQSCQQEIQK